MAKELLVVVSGAKKELKCCNGKLGYISDVVYNNTQIDTLRVVFKYPVKVPNCVGEMLTGVFKRSEITVITRKAIMSDEKRQELELRAQERAKKQADKKSGRTLVKRK